MADSGNYQDIAIGRIFRKLVAGVRSALNPRTHLTFGDGFTITDDPANEETRIDVTGGGGGGGGTEHIADTLAALRALADGDVADGQLWTVKNQPADGFVYSSGTGAGLADDGRTIIKRTATLLASPGRFYLANQSAVVPTYAAARLATSSVHDVLQVQARTATGDGGAGVFDYDPTDTTSADNDGTILVAGNRRYKRRYSGLLHSEWFGMRGDLAKSRTDAKVVAGSTTLTTNAAAFTADDVGKMIQIAVPAPGTEGTGTLDFTTGSAAVVGSGTSFTTDFFPGMSFLIDRADGTQAVQLFVVKSVEDDTHLTLTNDSLPFHDLSARNWWTTATWTTTIAAYNSATSITLAAASAVTQNVGTTLCTRICYGPDQSDALEAARDALEAGQTLEVPAGHYLLSRAFEIGEVGGGKPVTLRGAGELENVSASLCGGADNILTDTVLGTVLHFTSSVGIKPMGRSLVKNLAIVGPGHNDILCGGYAPQEDGNAEGVFGAKLLFVNWRAGLDLEFTLGDAFDSIKAVGCIDGIRLGRGIDGIDTIVCNAVQITNIDVQLCGAGVALQQCKGISIIGGLNQANQISWRIKPYDPPSGAGIGGIEGVKVRNIYQELNQNTLYFHSQNGICRQVEFDKCFFGDVSHTIQFGRTGDYAIMGEFHFKECVLAAQKWSFPADVLVADVEFDNCTHPSGASDLFTFGDPATVIGLRVKGAYGDRTAQLVDSGATTVAGDGTYTPNWSVQAGGLHRLNFTGNGTIAAPTRIPAGAYIDFAITRTTQTVTWNAAYKDTPTLTDNSTTYVRFWTPNGTDFYLANRGAQGATGATGATGPAGADGAAGSQNVVEATVSANKTAGHTGADITLTGNWNMLYLDVTTEVDLRLLDASATTNERVEIANIGASTLTVKDNGSTLIGNVPPAVGGVPGYTIFFKRAGGWAQFGAGRIPA